MNNLNTANPLVQEVYEAAEEAVHEYVTYWYANNEEGIHSDEPGIDALDGGNVTSDMDPETIDAFLYTLMGNGGYELPPEMVEELSAFIRDFTDRAEIADRAAREARARRWKEQREQQQGGAS